MLSLTNMLDEVTEDAVKGALAINNDPLDGFLSVAGAALAHELGLTNSKTVHLCSAINRLGLVLFTLGCLRTLDLYSEPTL